MRLIRHYFPFFILTILVYGYFFYSHKQATIIPPHPLNSGKQAVQLQFVEIMEAVPEKKAQSEPRKEEGKTVKESRKKTDAQATEAINLQDPSQIKVAQKNLQKAIQETPAVSDAELKAELFEAEWQLDATTAAVAKKSPEQKTATLPAEKAIKTLHPVKETEALEVVQQEKTKPVFKKQPSDTPYSMETQGVLQEAIVVSGNIPVYPKRAILRNQQGRVVVKLIVTSKGKARNPQIMASSGYDILDNAVLNFIRKERFMPAHKGEEKVTSEQVFSFRFELR